MEKNIEDASDCIPDRMQFSISKQLKSFAVFKRIFERVGKLLEGMNAYVLTLNGPYGSGNEHS